MIVIKDIPSLKAYLDKGRFNHNDVIPFLSVLRNEISDRSLQSNMKWLNLFCNWSLHSEITSSIIVIDIMQSFLNSLLGWDAGDNNAISLFNDKIEVTPKFD